MKHDFLDKYGGLDSPIHRLDPRAKLISLFTAILIIISEARGELGGFAFYTVIVCALIIVSKVPAMFILKRCLIATPFIAMAAALIPLSFLLSAENADGSGSFAASVVIKAYLAIILLTLLTSSDRFHRILWGMRRLGMPKILGMLSALMYRHIFILLDEIHKTTRARESRTPGRLRTGKLRVYGNQAAVIFLRAWDRAERVGAAMLSRGFNGEFPDVETGKFSIIDAAGLFIITALFITVRLRGLLI